MKAREFNEIINKIAVDEKTKEGMLELIDVRNESNMKTLLNEFRIINLDFKSELKELRSDFKSEFRAIQEKSDSEFKIMYSELKRIESKNDTKTTLLMSFIGFLVLLMIALKFVY